MIADLDTLLIALYVELTDRIILHDRVASAVGPVGPPRSPTPNWSAWPWPRCCCATTTNTAGCGPRPAESGPVPPAAVSIGLQRRLRQLAWLLEAALRWLADHTPDTAELLRLLDGTPVVCGRSRTTAMRSALVGRVGYGDRVRAGQLQAGRRTPGRGGMLQAVPANRPAPGTLLVGDKGFAGGDFQTALADLELALVRPARTDEPDPGVFPN